MSEKVRRVSWFFDPPRLVTVDLAWVFLPPRRSKKDEHPIWIDAQGFDCSSMVPGLQHSWLRSGGGEWWGLCSFSIRSSNKHQLLASVTQLVRADHIQPITALLPENRQKFSRKDRDGTPDQFAETMESLDKQRHLRPHYYRDHHGNYDTPSRRQAP
jgi:hypothetical protein